MKTEHLYVGVDGGATKCIVRVEDAAGDLLGKEVGGPANIRQGVQQTWDAILSALDKILQPISSKISDYQLHAGMGLAGCELPQLYQAFINYPHPFASLIVTSDAHIACLGAHMGNDGAIIIAGTGVVGYQTQFGQVTRVSGWGFPHDDEGGGAWMGLQAVNTTLRWLDMRMPKSGIAAAVYDFFNQDQQQLVTWANQANSTRFAELAPLVIQQAKLGDQHAMYILRQAGEHISTVAATLLASQTGKDSPLPCAFVGGVAGALVPYLSISLRSRLRPCLATPEVGAIMLVRNKLKEKA